MDPFMVLGLEPTWDLDAQSIRDAQRRAAMRWHPDRVADPAERAEAASRVARVNEAATQLLDPLSRAQALLDRATPTPRPPEPRPEPAFLMSMVHVREGLDAGGSERTEALAELDRIEEAARRDAASCLASLQPADAAGWIAAAEAVGRLRAVRRAREAVHA
jgi:curved DNA-binding protein CbpA